MLVGATDSTKETARSCLLCSLLVAIAIFVGISSVGKGYIWRVIYANLIPCLTVVAMNLVPEMATTLVFSKVVGVLLIPVRDANYCRGCLHCATMGDALPSVYL